MAHAIDRLWKDPIEIARLSENNRRFGAENCTESNMRSDLAEILRHREIPLYQDGPPLHQGNSQTLSSRTAAGTR
jgi:hypothetical protein